MRKGKWIAVLGIVFVFTQAAAVEAADLKDAAEQQSYALGVDLARNLKRQGIAGDPAAIARGFQDELSGSKLLMTEEELRMRIVEFQTELKRTRAKTRAGVAEGNQQAGEAFLDTNKREAGVVSLPSGLQYKVLQEGGGRKPTESDTVDVNYRGILLNGMEFDNSYRRGHPVSFKVNGVIPGWTEALKLMPEGSKWQIFVPPELAYGEKGEGRLIGPNATLVFELELVAVK